MCAGTIALTTAEAAINTSGVICRARNASQNGDINFVAQGVRNSNASARDVICSLERQPLATSSTTQAFFINGDNLAGKSTSCVISSYEYNGTFLGSTSFVTSATSYDVNSTLPGSQATQFAYMSITCSLPGSSNGTLRGIYVYDFSIDATIRTRVANGAGNGTIRGRVLVGSLD